MYYRLKVWAGCLGKGLSGLINEFPGFPTLFFGLDEFWQLSSVKGGWRVATVGLASELTLNKDSVGSH